MKKFFTKMAMMVAFVLGVTTMNAQQLWPTADSATIRASQFADSTQIFWARTGGAAVPANHTGWVTRGLTATGTANKDSARFIHRADASASGGRFYGGFTDLASPSRLNGAAVFNSDLLEAQGTIAPHSGELVSPRMNTVGFSNIVVQFNQLYRNFQSQTLLSYSTDDGVTWSTPIDYNTDITVNTNSPDPVVRTNTNATLKRVKLAGAVGSANFRVKFTFTGRLYFYIFDDVRVFNVGFDLQSTPFYAIPPSLYTPKGQMEPLRFGATVFNFGYKPMTNVRYSVSIWNAATGARVFNATSAATATLQPDSTTARGALATSFDATTLNPGAYFGSYRVSGDSTSRELFADNDTARFDFVVSDTMPATNVVVANVGRSNYTKEDLNQTTTRNADSYWDATEAKSWRIGNFYRIQKGKGNTITSIIARVNPRAAAGTTLVGGLYEWKDANLDSRIQATERSLVAFAEIPIAAGIADANAWFLFKLQDLNTGKPFQPKDSTNYLATVEFDPGPPAATPVYPQAVFNQSYDYQGMDFVDTLGRYTIVVGKTGASEWSLGGYGDGRGGKAKLVPCVRINVAPFTTDVKNILSDDNKLTIYPNPSASASFITADVELVNASAAVVDIMTIDGKAVAEQVIDNMQKTQIQVDISDYAAGMYIFKLTTPNGIMTKRFVVTK
jgi:hypothetical protein